MDDSTSAAVFVSPTDGFTFSAISVAPADDPISEFGFTVELADAIPFKPAEFFVAFVNGSDPELGAIFVAITTELFAGMPFAVSRSEGLGACNICESALSSARIGLAKMADVATTSKIKNINAS
jgi:hypothetical protein